MRFAECSRNLLRKILDNEFCNGFSSWYIVSFSYLVVAFLFSTWVIEILPRLRPESTISISFKLLLLVRDPLAWWFPMVVVSFGRGRAFECRAILLI